MGLDRDAGALLLIQSDAPGAARADEVAVATAACEVSGAKEVFATDDPEEGELFVQARRLHFTAIETRGSVLPEDVGVPIPQLPALLAAVEEIAARHDVEIPVVAHAGDGNTHPAIIYTRRRRRTPSAGPGSPSTRSWRPPSSSAARSPASTASAGSRSGSLEAQLGPRRHGPHPPGQARPRPARHPQPRRRLLTPPGHGHRRPERAILRVRQPAGCRRREEPSCGRASSGSSSSWGSSSW